MWTRNPEMTISASAEFSKATRRGVVLLRVYDRGKESLHRLPLPETAFSESRAQLQAVYEALQWGRKMQKRHIVVLTDCENAPGLIEQTIPLNEHVAGLFLQIRALRHAFDSADIRYVSNSALAAAV